MGEARRRKERTAVIDGYVKSYLPENVYEFTMPIAHIDVDHPFRCVMDKAQMIAWLSTMEEMLRRGDFAAAAAGYMVKKNDKILTVWLPRDRFQKIYDKARSLHPDWPLVEPKV